MEALHNWYWFLFWLAFAVYQTSPKLTGLKRWLIISHSSVGWQSGWFCHGSWLGTFMFLWSSHSSVGLEGPECPHSQIWQLMLVVFQSTLVVFYMAFYFPVEWTGFLLSMVDSNGGKGEAARPLNPTFWNLNNTIFTPILWVKGDYQASPESMCEEVDSLSWEK